MTTSTSDPGAPNRLGRNPGIPPVPKRAKDSTTMGGAALGGTGKWLDERLGMAPKLRRTLNKVFPDHWSFMLGEIALYSFVILLLTGTYLTFFFKASSTEVVYHGSYMPLRGTTMTEAYASTLNISFDVRAGLIMRQIHHWAALLFVASICVHMMRVFFTGAFRKPRELNWVIGVGLLVLAILEGFAGYSLPDDLLSGTGLRIAYSITESAPVMGSYLAWFLFGGDFPGDAFISRLYAVHILLIPGILVALISAHMALLVHQKHTQFPGPGRTETNVVGSRLFPGFSAKTGGFFFIVFGACAALASLFQINPIWLFGPYEARNVSAGSQPDWYMGFLDGSSRLMPGWEIRLFGHTIPPIVWPAVILPGILMALVGGYPWIEQKLTGDKNYHHLLDRPRDRPVRTAAGAGFIAFYISLWLSGGNDVLASIFHISLNATTFAGRALVVFSPPITYLVTKRICLNLQARSDAVAHHGVETGFISMSPDGQYAEIHAPAPQPKHHTPIPVLPDDLRELEAGSGH
ncbi:MAG TPA: ubiquinol-cytochrome c reductase cytochrome b subunit [Mycobacteriales bacterium]|nr:ubiquinol-cytochrome c reductase cytochrome b subunit [Mycobacteriales bacterium]